MSRIDIDYSGLTKKIRAGHTAANGKTFKPGHSDVTDAAINAVARKVLDEEETFAVVDGEIYYVTVEKVVKP